MSSGKKDSSDESPPLFQPNEEIITQIMSVGFSRNAAIKGLFYTGNQTADQAAEWLFENNDRNNDTPLEAELSDSSDEEDLMTTYSFKMVFAVNSELNMGIGKIAAQVAHASISLFRNMIEDEAKSDMLRAWGHFGETKIVLKAESTLQLETLASQAALLHIDHYLVQDAGHTQVAPGSKTVLGLFGKVDDVDRITGKLKLL